ncbi:hypothetical protein JIN85_10830 [Luteolibacter pohnpeiensis]|uniref:Mannosyl-glycoprotein endo-beta-N-acetylglucosaminidase n=1 Tax=Luteolibacter pohnpeiensis TaxID=454153 RepID=A0A934S6T9_9BACT|nr:hypothetical protein [Luteolibacter pohnpeiensis]MBK1882913.1 hypothetical protein [Luteolibacter pohnpeiensis]
MIYIPGRRISALRVFPLALASSLFAATFSHAAEKSFSQFRFTPTRLRDSSSPNSVQVSEFRFLLGGNLVDLSSATAVNAAGTSPATEGPEKLIDGSTDTKWLNYAKQGVIIRFPEITTIDAYSFSTANDSQERDPGNWKLEGSNDGTNWFLLDVRINGSVPSDRKASTDTFSLPVTVPPYASFWHPDYLLKWTPEADPDSDFNRASIPITSRMANPALKVNFNARSNEAKITILSSFGSTSFLPSQGAKVAHFNAYTGWQYTDKLVFWGGSAGEGIILAPAAPIVDAAHRNGVPVLGNVFFPPNVYGGQFHWVQTFLQKSGDAFPVADKMIEVARYYGFDGWFINQETGGGSTADATNMRDFISYFKAQAPDLQIMWYDAMTRTGSISWQNALTSENEQFVKSDGNAIADSMFLNFWWNSDMLSSTRSRALGLGLDPYSIYAGIDVESAGTGTSVSWDAIFPNRSQHRVSVAFYGEQALFRNSGNPGQFRQNELRFWSGQNADPSNTSTTESWKGMANYVPAQSPLEKLPFVTNFNRGQGDRYLIDGQVVSTSGWNNLSLQDVLPTWRWIVSSTGTKLTPALLFEDSYYGGSSLKISGQLDATNDIKLYAASLPVSADTKFKLVYKTGTASAPSNLKLAIAFEDAPSSPVYYDVGSTSTNGWNTVTFDLGSHAGQKIATIGVRCSSTSVIENYVVRLGQFAIYDGTPTPPAAVTDLRIIQNDPSTLDNTNLRIKWSASSTGNIYYYNVFQRLADGSRLWLGATPANAFYAANVARSGNQSSAMIEVEAVGSDFAISSAAEVAAAFPPQPEANFQLTGTIIGTEGSWSNLGDVRENVFDGNFNTAFDAPDEFGAWVGLDLGSAAQITALRYAPRSGFAARMVGGVFEGANSVDFSDAVTIYTIPDQPPVGSFTSVPVTNPHTFRYLRYRSDPNCNIAELEVYGLRLPDTPGTIVASTDPGGALLTWNTTPWATSYRLERGTSASGPFTVIADQLGSTSYTDPDAPAETELFYRVIAINSLGESSASAVTPLAANLIGFAAWQQSQFADETDESIIGQLADPDHDQIPNLLEYALGTDPAVANPPLEPGVDEATLSLTYTQNADATDISLKAQWSDDLQTWSDVGVIYETLSEQAQTQTIRATVAIGSGGHRFLRLQAVSE